MNYVKQALSNAEAGHDWWHVERVWKNAKLIGEHEDVNMFVVELAALLHDIADSKFHEGNDEMGPSIAVEFLNSLEIDKDTVQHVEQIIRNMSFRSSFGYIDCYSRELKVVQDADRLDAIGAIGVARTFSYGGFKNREMHNPTVSPNLNMSKDEYKNSTAPTINHFYEKLLLLKDKMNTSTGKRIAQQRHDFMEQYLEQFYAEWEGKR